MSDIDEVNAVLREYAAMLSKKAFGDQPANVVIVMVEDTPDGDLTTVQHGQIVDGEFVKKEQAE